MKIQVNTDHNIGGHQALITEVTGKVESALSRFSDHITRVEVHLSDQNSHRNSPGGKRCMMEARLEGRQPIAVTQEADTGEQSIDGATDKLDKLIENTLGREHDQKGHRAASSSPESKLPEEKTILRKYLNWIVRKRDHE